MSKRTSRWRSIVLACHGTQRRKAAVALAGAVASVFAGSPAFAANYYWDGQSVNANWSSTAGGTNWSSSATTLSDPGTVPGSGDDVFFSLSSTSIATNTMVDTPFSIKGLTFNTNASGSVGIGGSSLLTLGTDGLTVVTGSSAPATLSTNVAIGAVQTWANNATSASNTLIVSGVLSGSAALTLSGTGSTITPSGSFVFQNANTYFGALSLLNANTSLTLSSNGTTSGTLGSAASIAVGGGASLTLDNTNAVATRLGAALPVTSTGGSIKLIGNSSSTVSDSIGTLTLGTGGTSITVAPNGQTTTLTINGLARNVGTSSVTGTTIGTLGGTLNFAPIPANAVISMPNQPAGFIGAWATVGVQDNTGNLDFAVVSGGIVTALSTYNTGAVTTWLTTDDVKNSTTQALTAASNPTIHTFYSTTAGILNVNANTLTLGSGGVIANGGTGSYVVNGNQTMNSASVLGGTGFSAGASDIVTGSKITVAAGVPDFVFKIAGNSAIVLNGTTNISTGVLQVNAALVDGPNPSGTFAASTTTSSNIVTLTTGNTSQLYPGVTVTGLTGLSGTQTITSVISSTQFAVASNATTGGSATPAFTSHTGLTKTGGGLLDLANGNNAGDGNTFSGPITINGGTVLVRADTDFGTAPGSATPNAITLNGGEIRSTAGFGISSNRGITVGPQGGTLSYDGGGTFTATSKITGVGGMNFESISNQGATTFQLDTGAGGLTYQGPTSLVTKTVSGQAASVLIFEIAQELPSNTPVTIASFESTYGTVNVNNLGQTIGSLSSTGIVGSFTPTITNISNLTIGGTSGSPVNQSAVYAGTLAGVNLTKNGGGTQTFSNANSYSGTTTLNGGTLLATNTTGSATGTSTVTVNSSAALGGNGIITGAVTVASGGAIAPAVFGTPSTLQLKGGLTLNGGSLLNVSLGAINSGTNPIASPTSDNVFVTGNLVMTAGTDTINITPLSVSGVTTFTTGTYHLITNTGTNPSLTGITFNVNGPVQYLYSVTDNVGGDTSLDLNVSINPNPSLTWLGAPGNGTWDQVGGDPTNTPWKGSQGYVDGANLTFDNTPGGVNSAISIPGNVVPGSLTFNNNGFNNYTFSGAGMITGSAGLTMNGNGTVTFNNTNTFTGTAAINNGTLVVASTGALANAAFNIASGAALTVNGTLAATAITNAGTLTVGSTAAINGSSTLSNSTTATFNNATQTLAGLSGAGSLVLNGTALTVGGGVSEYDGVISGTAASLTVNNGASLNLTNANTYGGGTTVSGGTLIAKNTSGSATGPGPVAVNNGGILGGSGSIAGAVTLSATGVGHLQPGIGSGGVATTLTVNNNLTLGAGSVLDFGFGNTPSSDNVQVNGNLTLNAGTDILNLSTFAGATPGGNYKLIGFTGTLVDNATFTINNVPAGDSASVLTPTTGGVPNQLVLSIQGPPLTWTGVNGPAGAGAWDTTTLNWATQPATSPVAFTSFSPVTFDNTGANTTITVVAGGVTPGNMTFNNSTVPYIIGGGPINGGGAMTLSATAGSVTLNGANGFTGGININGGSLLLEPPAGVTTSPQTVTAAGTGTIAVNTGGTLSIGAPNIVISVTTPTPTTTGVAVTVNNAMTLAGGTVGVSGPVGPGYATTLGGTLTATPGTTTIIDDFDPLNPTVTPAAGQDLILTGSLSGGGNLLVQSVPGDPRDANGVRLRDSTASTFSGTIIVQPSTKFELQTNTTTGSPIGTGKVIFQGGTVTNTTTGGTFPIVNIRNSSGANAVFGNNFQVTLNGTVFFNQLGGIAGSNTTFGNLDVGGAGLSQTITTGAATGAVSETMIFPTVTTEGGTVTFEAEIPGNTQYASAENFSLGPISESITSAGTNIVFNSNATVTLTGANSYTGSTTVGAATGGGTGTLFLKAPGALPPAAALTMNSGTVDLNSGTVSNNQTVASLAGAGGTITNSDGTNAHTFTVAQSANTTYSGVIAGNLAFTKSGGGTLILAGSSTFTGPATITGGVLSVTGSTGTSTVTVSSTATLAGNGTIGGTVNVSAGGELAPSAGLTSPIGHPLTITGPVALTGTATYTVVLASPTAGTNPTGYDQIQFGNTVNLGGANLVVNDSAYLASGNPKAGDQFWVMDAVAGNTNVGQLTGVFAQGATVTDPTQAVTYLISYNVLGDPDNPTALTTNDVLLTVASVPEPASIGILAVAGLGLLTRRRRRVPLLK